MFRAHITQYSKVHFFLVFKRARVHQTTRAAAPNHLHKHMGPPTEFDFLLRTFSSRNEWLTKKQARIWQCDHVCYHQRVGLGSPGAAAFYEADLFHGFRKFTQLRSKPCTATAWFIVILR
jgi:hypothetical protein